MDIILSEGCKIQLLALDERLNLCKKGLRYVAVFVNAYKETKPTYLKIAKKLFEYEKQLVDQMRELVSEDQALYLAERKTFKPWRALTEIEKKVDFEFLNTSFNDLEDGLRQQLVDEAMRSIVKAVKRTEGRLKASDIAGIAGISFISAREIAKIIADFNKQSFEVGKKSASGELDVERPITKRKNTQLMNFEAQQIAETFRSEINVKTKEIAKEGLAKDLATPLVVAAIIGQASGTSNTLINNIVGSVVGQNINKGRRFVFEDNIKIIKAFQRSEILDSRTCNMCLTLDQRIVKADDPIAQMDSVHTRCRGEWVAITLEEKIEGKVGIPKTALKGFDTIGGVPTINRFKQLKRPFNAGNKKAQKEIERRIKETS